MYEQQKTFAWVHPYWPCNVLSWSLELSCFCLLKDSIMGLKEVDRTNCYAHQRHFTLFSVHLYICECVWAVHKHAHLNECDYCCLWGCTSPPCELCGAAVLWSSWPRKAPRQRAETFCMVTEGGGIQELVLSFTEPGSSLTLSVAPPTTNRSGAVECCRSKMRTGINQKFTLTLWETIFE